MARCCGNATLGAAIRLWLFGVSVLDVAPYVYDAKVPQLMLLGGRTGEDGGHDWIHLLSTLGLLERSQGIGWFVHKLGAIVVLLALAWAAWRLWQQKSRLGETWMNRERRLDDHRTPPDP